jgi:hypothetical protein
VGVVGLGALLVLALVRRSVHRRREQLAHRAALRQGEPLHVGPSVLAGVVADEHEGDAVVIAIEQQGREFKTKSGWAHRWSEQRRTVEAKPFYVTRANGERVRVEPDSRVLLVDRLDATERQAIDQRVRRARLSPGEHVFVLGVMTRAADPKLGGYRESAEGWVLRPPRGERMLISTEPLEDRHQRRARIWRNLALITAALLLVWHGLLFAHVHRLRWHGRPLTAVAVHKEWNRAWVRPSKGRAHWVYHYYVTAAGEDGARWTAEVERRSYDEITTDGGSGTPLAFLAVDGPQGHFQIGTRACARIELVVVGMMNAVVWLFIYVLAIFSTRPWWARRRVVESGSGRLSDSR